MTDRAKRTFMAKMIYPVCHIKNNSTAARITISLTHIAFLVKDTGPCTMVAVAKNITLAEY